MAIKIKIPNSLSEITLRQYKRFLKIQQSETEDRFLNAKMIEIFCNIELKDVIRLKLKDTNDIISVLSELFNQKPSLVTKFKLNGVEYGFHPELDDLLLGEYIDLDNFIGDWDNMEKAMNVLYRPIIVRLKDKYNIEEYQIENSVNLLDMPMDAVLSSIFFFVEFRSRIVANYDELFGGGGDRSLDSVSQFSRKWGWYQSIFGLANGDITRFEDITKLGMHKCFTMLSFMKDKNEMEAKQIKKKFK